MAQPVLTVHFGDLHVGGTTAICPPEVELDEGGHYCASPDQVWFWDCWRRFWDDTAELARKLEAKILAVSGGDDGEGDHHQTTQIWFTSGADQERAVEQVYGAAIADAWVFVRCTEAHDGPLSAGTEGRARAFAEKGWKVLKDRGRFSWWIWTGVVGGVKLQVKHEPQTMSRVPYTTDQAATRQAHYVWEEYCQAGIGPPDVALYHHVHKRAQGWHAGLACYYLPGWQLPTAWVLKRQSTPRLEPPGGLRILCQDGDWRPFWKTYRPESRVAWAR